MIASIAWNLYVMLTFIAHSLLSASAYALIVAVVINMSVWLYLVRQLRRIRRSKNIMLRIMEEY